MQIIFSSEADSSISRSNVWLMDFFCWEQFHFTLETSFRSLYCLYMAKKIQWYIVHKFSLDRSNHPLAWNNFSATNVTKLQVFLLYSTCFMLPWTLASCTYVFCTSYNLLSCFNERILWIWSQRTPGPQRLLACSKYKPHKEAHKQRSQKQILCRRRNRWYEAC